MHIRLLSGLSSSSLLTSHCPISVPCSIPLHVSSLSNLPAHSSHLASFSLLSFSFHPLSILPFYPSQATDFRSRCPEGERKRNAPCHARENHTRESVEAPLGHMSAQPGDLKLNLKLKLRLCSPVEIALLCHIAEYFLSSLFASSPTPSPPCHLLLLLILLSPDVPLHLTLFSSFLLTISILLFSS